MSSAMILLYGALSSKTVMLLGITKFGGAFLTPTIIRNLRGSVRSVSGSPLSSLSCNENDCRPKAPATRLKISTPLLSILGGREKRIAASVSFSGVTMNDRV